MLPYIYVCVLISFLLMKFPLGRAPSLAARRKPFVTEDIKTAFSSCQAAMRV